MHESSHESRRIPSLVHTLQRSRDDAKSQVTAMKQEVEQALQQVQSAHKERNIARDLASSLLQEQVNLKQQLELWVHSSPAPQVIPAPKLHTWTQHTLHALCLSHHHTSVTHMVFVG